ncbi:MAG: gfo/Idh/MocA family oxidoreductase [Planctomycetota bacterium]|nr:MAG: gfo/Idh/MocA family oxidoreductase [Planctomycetota bacterium]
MTTPRTSPASTPARPALDYRAFCGWSFRWRGNLPRRVTAPRCILAALLAVVLSPLVLGQDARQQENPIRIGIIGLDTSHAPAFTKLINEARGSGPLANMRVVAAFPGGSPDLPSSRDRVAGYTEQLRGMGVRIVDSIAALLEEVDAVLLESVDGRRHLEQAIPVFRSGKPVFIDKPLAADLTEAVAIDMLGRKYNARWFSSSSLRFSPSIYRFRIDDQLHQKVRGAIAWSPCSLDPTHVDLTWYGIHGVETLYTAMGTGCTHVARVATEGAEVVTGVWDDGRLGTFRGIRDGQRGYGLVVFGSDAIHVGGKYEGYAPLVEQIALFFQGGAPPVDHAETIEMFAFMQAAQESKLRDGALVALQTVLDEATVAAQALVARIDP